MRGDSAQAPCSITKFSGAQSSRSTHTGMLHRRAPSLRGAGVNRSPSSSSTGAGRKAAQGRQAPPTPSPPLPSFLQVFSLPLRRADGPRAARARQAGSRKYTFCQRSLLSASFYRDHPSLLVPPQTQTCALSPLSLGDPATWAEEGKDFEEQSGDREAQGQRRQEAPQTFLWHLLWPWGAGGQKSRLL